MKHTDEQNNPKIVTTQSPMPNTVEFWSRGSEILKVFGFVVAGLALLVAVIGWHFSSRAGALKDEASKEAKAASDMAIAEVNAAAARANERAADAELKTQRLKKELGWREISASQSDIIRSEISPRPMQVTISWSSGAPESAALAQRIGRVLVDSGCELSAFAPMSFLGEQPIDLKVSGSESDEIDLLSRALRKAGLGVVNLDKTERKPDGSKYFTNIMVGFRRPPDLSDFHE